jgi:hypothetical protein
VFLQLLHLPESRRTFAFVRPNVVFFAIILQSKSPESDKAVASSPTPRFRKSSMAKAEAIDPALMELGASPSPQPTPGRTRSRTLKVVSREPTPSRGAGSSRPTGMQHLSSQTAGPSASALLLSQTEQLQHVFADPVRQQAQAMDEDVDEDKDREELDEETLATIMYNQ